MIIHILETKGGGSGGGAGSNCKVSILILILKIQFKSWKALHTESKTIKISQNEIFMRGQNGYFGLRMVLLITF